MAAPARVDRIYTFACEGIVSIAPTQGFGGQDQITILFSSAEKMTELVMMWRLTDSNPMYSCYLLTPSAPNELHLWGYSTGSTGFSNHTKLLEVLQGAIVPKEGAPIFQYTWIQRL